MTQNTKTPIMVLQELSVKQAVAPPEYKVVQQEAGTLEHNFNVVVSVAGIQANGSGPSKKIGKHQAAHNALKKLEEIGIYDPLANPVGQFNVSSKQQDKDDKSALNSMGALHTLCIKNKLPNPEYFEISSVGPPHAQVFTYECKILSVSSEAKANTKRMAKQLAAKGILQKINDVLPDLIVAQNEKIQKLMNRDADEKTNDAKGVKAEEIPQALEKLIKLENLTYKDVAEDLLDGTEEALKRILDKLKVSYELLPLATNKLMAVLTLKTDPPFVMMGIGGTYEEAVQNAIKQAFTFLKCFLKTEIE